MSDEVKFAKTYIEVDNELVAKVTKFSRKVDIEEEDTTGSEDYIAGTDVLHKQFVSISVGETADIEGITRESSISGLQDGQSELRDAAETGKAVTVKQSRYTGFGWLLRGFFTSYEEDGEKGGVYKWKGTFRINSKTEVTPGS
jgi:hypothetical protein